MAGWGEGGARGLFGSCGLGRRGAHLAWQGCRESKVGPRPSRLALPWAGLHPTPGTPGCFGMSGSGYARLVWLPRGGPKGGGPGMQLPHSRQQVQGRW